MVEMGNDSCVIEATSNRRSDACHPPSTYVHAVRRPGLAARIPRQARQQSARYREGYQLGLTDARTGGMTLICGPPDETAEMAAG